MLLTFRYVNLAFVASLCQIDSFAFCLGNKDFMLIEKSRAPVIFKSLFKSVPGRNLVAPPELARDAPGLDVLHPIEIGRFPLFRDKDSAVVTNGADRLLRQRLGVDIPLIGQERLGHGTGALAVRHHMCMSFRFLEQTGVLKRIDNALAGDKSILTIEVPDCYVRLRDKFVSNVRLEIEIRRQEKPSFFIKDVDGPVVA